MINKTAFALTGVTLGLVSTAMIPVLTHAQVQKGEFIIGATGSIIESPTNPDEASISKKYDKDRYTYYTKTVLKDDKNASNKLFRTDEHGFTYWTPVRNNLKKDKGVSNPELIYENLYTAKKYGDSSNQWWLGLYFGDASKTHNFKTVQMIPANRSEVTGLGKWSIANYVEKSPKYNNGGTFKGESGRWRFSGYTADGSSALDALFPPDYSESALLDNENTVFYQYSKVPDSSALFTQTAYDTSEFKTAKQNLIKRLMKQYPEMKQKNSKVSYWMKVLSLQTQPQQNPKNNNKKDGNYGGALFAAYTNGGANYRTMLLLDDKNGSINLNMKKIQIYDGKKLVASIERTKSEARVTKNKTIKTQLMPGKTYRVVSTVKNESKAVDSKLNPTTTLTGYSLNYKSSLEADGYYRKSNDNKTKTATKDGTIPANKSVTTETTLTIPSSAEPGSNIRFGSIISDKHRQTGDNRNQTDDDLSLVLEVAKGNVTAKETVLVDENGNEVSSPIPGHQYKIRYYFDYNGIKKKSTITIDYLNTRKLPDGSQETIKYKDGSTTTKDTAVSKSMTLEDGKTYHLDTKYLQWYEIPYVNTTAKLKSSVAAINTDGNDDEFGKTWDPKYDYSIENLQVVARTERDGVASDGKQHYGVSFSVDTNMPTAAVNDHYAQDVKIRVKIGGQTKTYTEHIVSGTDKNKNIVFDVAFDKAVKSGKSLNATVEVNYDKGAYETDTELQNNKATTTVTTANITTDATTGAKTNPSNNSTNTGAYVTTPVNPNKFKKVTTDNNSNTWTQNYNVSTWTGTKHTYYSVLNGKQKAHSFYKFSEANSTTTPVKQQESYKIKEVLMKSKVTTDKKWGANKDGWVSLITDSGHAQVKAGYGYQLKMTVEYSTNAFSTQPASSNSNGSGTSVRPKNVLPNVSKDVYFETSDGKILSASGINKTNQVLTANVTSETKDKITIEYTLASNTTMGVKTPGRIYISEKTPNGIYPVKAWTPTINGVPTKNLTTDNKGLTLYTPENLVDILGANVSSKGKPVPANPNDVPSMNIVVVGSDKDDLVNSVVQ